MRISDWSSDVCSSDLGFCVIGLVGGVGIAIDTSVAYNVKSRLSAAVDAAALAGARAFASPTRDADIEKFFEANFPAGYMGSVLEPLGIASDPEARTVTVTANATIPTFFMRVLGRSEEHTSELQSLMRNSSAVCCLKKKH